MFAWCMTCHISAIALASQYKMHQILLLTLHGRLQLNLFHLPPITDHQLVIVLQGVYNVDEYIAIADKNKLIAD